MPIYEYRCQKCGQTFEELVYRSTQEQELACPSCGAKAAKRQLSRPASLAVSGCGSGSGGSSFG